MTFEEMAIKSNNTIMCIERNGVVLARGVYVKDSLLAFDDAKVSVISYPDTGTFVLFRSSQTNSKEEKYRDYIDEDNRTKIEIVFQSRNAASDFVLGENGRTNHWKKWWL